jgi:phosphocarrier protein HPr
MSATASAKIEITHAVGLHARPSVKFTKLAKTFPASVEMALAEAGPWIDAKSIVKVMAAKAPKGTTLYLRASGEGAAEAVEALVALVTRDFDEASEGEAHVRSA